MALIFLGILTVFTISSFSKSDCLHFIANDEWPNSPHLSLLDYQVWGNAGDLSQAATEAKNSS